MAHADPPLERFAVIADIHGNRLALEAVLTDISNPRTGTWSITQ